MHVNKVYTTLVLQLNNKTMKPTNNIIKFLQTELTYDESVTARNCKDLGFGARKIKNVILDMRSKGINYLSQRKLESYR